MLNTENFKVWITNPWGFFSDKLDFTASNLQGHHNVRCMHAVVWKVHGYCFKNSVFYKEKKVPNPLETFTQIYF